MGSHFGVGAPPIVEPILVGVESDVHWGYDLDFDPWPYMHSHDSFAMAHVLPLPIGCSEDLRGELAQAHRP